MARHFSTKTYGNDRGFSCAFRQWKATDSHCSKLHGYSLGFKIVFEADQLNDRNWVQDFGGLDDLESWLRENFDHKLLVAEDDPALEQLINLGADVADSIKVSAVGCEAFAQLVYEHVFEWLMNDPLNKYQNMLGDEYQRVFVKGVECFEHSGNSATYGD